MKKLFLLIILALGITLAEPVVGNAYVISALGIKNSPNDVDYVSGDTSVSGNANYVLSPQVIIYQEGLSYVGSYTPFTGCLNSQHYTNGSPDGLCITGIVNDLTTGGTDKALSAEQGKVLNDKITNLQSITRINYLRPTLQTTTLNGITCTNNGDGTYTLNGTATGNARFTLFKSNNYILKSNYKLTGCPKGGSNSTFRMYLDGQNNGYKFYGDLGDGARIVSGTYTTMSIVIDIFSGYTCDNLVFKPMLTTDLDAAYDDFVSFDNSIVTGISSGIKMDLLWENTSPSSAFNSQTINVINNNYVFYYITYRRKSTDSGSTNTFSLIKVGGTDHPTTEYARKIFYREVSTSNSVISFSNGGYADSYGGVSTQDSTVMVPVYIYGIK